MTSNTRFIRNLGSAFAFAGLAVMLIVSNTTGQTPAAGSGMTLTATTATAGLPAEPVKINLVRWSTDEERTAIVASMSPPPRGAAPGRGGPRGGAPVDATDPFGTFGRGVANPNLPVDPAAVPPPTPAAGAAPARGAVPGRGGAAGAPSPFDPIVSLTAALGKAPTVGYLWTTETAGYSIKYAYRNATPDGNERIVLVLNRPLSTVNAAPVTGLNYTVVEMRLAKGVGEAKASSVNTKVIVDADTLALENFAAAPVVFKNVKR